MEKVRSFNLLSKQLLSTLGNTKPNREQVRLTESLLLRSTINHEMIFHKALSQREIYCLLLAAKGETMNEVAKIMKVKYSTVETWYKKIKLKLSCRSITHAVYEGIRYGYIKN